MAGYARLESAAVAGRPADVSGALGHKAEYISGEGWYFRARRRFLAGLVSRRLPPGSLILDVGCGDGRLAVLLPEYVWRGVEPDPALRALALENGAAAVCGTAEDLPFGDGGFDAVCMFDVLEHVENDRAALFEAWRVLRLGGLLFVSAPLHPELWSAHDEACGHRRRYRKGELAALAGPAGFKELGRKYFVSLFLPAVWLARKLVRGGPGRLPALLDRAAGAALALDASLGLPFGLSEALILQKV